MSTNILEINDSEIRVAKKDKIILRSPGFAVIDGDKIKLGENAISQAYLHPRQTYNRFWSKLNQDALQTPTDNYRHHADLAYAHLINIHEEAGRPEEIIFAVPGSFSSEQLSLLLGITEACPFNAVGLVDIAVASAAAVADEGDYVHADIHLYQTILTNLSIGGEVKRGVIEIIDDTGMNTIMTRASSLIADLFIKQSRFDPLHNAETEQAIHDQLPVCLTTLLTNKEVLLEIPYNNATHQAKLSRDHLIQGLRGIYESITKSLPANKTVLVSDRLASLPGFIECLSENHTLTPEDVFRGCMDHELKIRTDGEGLDYITTLPTAKNPTVSISTYVATPQTAPERKGVLSNIPSHVLDGYQAWSLNNGQMYLSSDQVLGTDNNGNSNCSLIFENGDSVLFSNGSRTVYVNGDIVDDRRNVFAGDKISFSNSNKNYLLICIN